MNCRKSARRSAPLPHPNAGRSQSRSQQAGNDVRRRRFSPLDRSFPPHAIPTQRRKLRPIERIEHPVPLSDVQIRLLCRNASKSSTKQTRRNAPNPRKLPDSGPPGQESKSHVRVRDSGGGWSVLHFFGSRIAASRQRPTEIVKRNPPSESRSHQRPDRYLEPGGRPHFRQVHVLQDRSRLAP